MSPWLNSSYKKCQGKLLYFDAYQKRAQPLSLTRINRGEVTLKKLGFLSFASFVFFSDKDSAFYTDYKEMTIIKILMYEWYFLHYFLSNCLSYHMMKAWIRANTINVLLWHYSVSDVNVINTSGIKNLYASTT